MEVTMRLAQAAVVGMAAASLAACQDAENVLTSDLARIEVQNLRGSALLSVYTPPCSGGPLGKDRLEDLDVDVPPGGLNSFHIDPGCYDVVGDFAGGARQTVTGV